MTNPNPFVPKGSLLEQQSARRSRLKLAVFCTVAVSSVGLVAMLIQGCKREQPADNTTTPDISTNTPDLSTNVTPIVDTNPIALPPPSTNTTPAYIAPPPPLQQIQTPVAPETSTYKITKGDTLGKVAKAHGVSLKALEAANPGVDSKHLKVGQSINIPAGGASVGAATSTPTLGTDVAAGDTYSVKSGDTLSKIAKANGVSLKALEAANPGVSSNHLKVNQKLKLPAKAAAAPVIADPAPAVTPMPVLPPPSTAPAAPAATPTK
jgi:LysM repeat protein